MEKEVTQVVCGAPNVPNPGEPGRSPRVLWAKPGATLPNGLVLSVREVRGIPSPGMLCAEDELGLSEDHDGIVILSPDDGIDIGGDVAQAAGLPDWVFELDITPNRPDLLVTQASRVKLRRCSVTKACDFGSSRSIWRHFAAIRHKPNQRKLSSKTAGLARAIWATSSAA